MNAPVAIFVYNRLDNTRRTIEALIRNDEASQTPVYVFSDGGRDEKSWRSVNAVRDFLHQLQRRVEAEHLFLILTLVERPFNYYLERNIMEGIGQVFEQHDRIIVLEDDIVTSPFFLRYMNEAFRLYADTPQVMHVAGFTNLDLLSDTSSADRPDFYFTPHMSGWGWGTWRDRWQKHFRHFSSEQEALEGMTAQDMDNIQYGGVFPCLRSLKKKPIPWDICWEMAIYRERGLCLTPAHTLVRNIGLMNGTHFRAFSFLQHYEFDRQPLTRPLRLSYRQPVADPHIESLFANAIRDWGIRYTWLGRMVRWVYKKVKGSNKPDD